MVPLVATLTLESPSLRSPIKRVGSPCEVATAMAVAAVGRVRAGVCRGADQTLIGTFSPLSASVSADGNLLHDVKPEGESSSLDPPPLSSHHHQTPITNA